MTLRVPSGDTDQGVSFNATPGLALANFSVYRSRNGAAAVAMTTPTITEDGTLGGLYHLTLDEDMSVAAGNVTEDMLFTVRHSDIPSWSAEFRVELFVPAPIRKNVAFPSFMFVMKDSDGALLTGLSVTGSVSLDGGAFSGLTNAVSEVASGWYKVSLAAADLNGNVVALRFTATGAGDTTFTLIPARA